VTGCYPTIATRPRHSAGVRQQHLDNRRLQHRLRHFLFTWLKKQGIDDALIQPYSGHASRQSLEIYSRLALGEA